MRYYKIDKKHSRLRNSLFLLFFLALNISFVSSFSIENSFPYSEYVSLNFNQNEYFYVNISSNNSEDYFNYFWYIDDVLVKEVDNEEVYERLSYNISLANFSKFLDFSEYDEYPQGIFFSSDGDDLFVIGGNTRSIYQFELSESYDFEEVYLSNILDVGEVDSEPTAISFSEDGMIMFITGTQYGKVYQYSLSNPFDIEEAQLVNVHSFADDDSQPTGIVFDSEGFKMFISGADNGLIYEYFLLESYDISTAELIAVLNVSENDPEPSGIGFSADGYKMFLIGQSEINIYEYELSESFSISSAVFTEIHDLSSEDRYPFDIAFSNDGFKMFILGVQKFGIYEYSLTVSSKLFSFSNYLVRGLNFSLGSHQVKVEVFDGEGNNDSVIWSLTIRNPVTSSRGSSGSISKECSETWICEKWSDCSEDGLMKRDCNYVGSCKVDDSKKPSYLKTQKGCDNKEDTYEEKIQEIKESKGYIPKQLLDITFEVVKNNISSANELTTLSTFISFGTEPAKVNLTYLIINENNFEVYRENDFVLVETEMYNRKNFAGLNLPYGNYKMILETIYGDDVRTSFEKSFVVSPKVTPSQDDDYPFWISLLTVLTIIVIILNLVLLARTKK